MSREIILVCDYCKKVLNLNFYDKGFEKFLSVRNGNFLTTDGKFKGPELTFCSKKCLANWCVKEDGSEE